jgi:hypothetical protein
MGYLYVPSGMSGVSNNNDLLATGAGWGRSYPGGQSCASARKRLNRRCPPSTSLVPSNAAPSTAVTAGMSGLGVTARPVVNWYGPPIQRRIPSSPVTVNRTLPRNPTPQQNSYTVPSQCTIEPNGARVCTAASEPISTGNGWGGGRNGWNNGNSRNNQNNQNTDNNPICVSPTYSGYNPSSAVCASSPTAQAALAASAAATTAASTAATTTGTTDWTTYLLLGGAALLVVMMFKK